MAKLILNGEEVFVQEQEEIKEKCEEAGVPFCCKEGICGTCLVEVEEGMEYLSDFTDEEKDYLGEVGAERLACQCKIKKGVLNDHFVKIKY